MSEPLPTLNFGEIRTDRFKVVEMKDEAEVLNISRDDLERISLKRGLSAERPVLQLLFGLAMTVPGLLMLPAYYRWAFAGAEITIGPAVIFVFLIPVGIWFATNALRRRYFLYLELSSGSRKTEFPRGTAVDAIKEYLALVESDFGYEIHLEE